MTTLIDSSAWIEYLRPHGNKNVADAVEEVLLTGEAGLCPFVELELRIGSRNKAEDKQLSELFNSLIPLPMSDKVWDYSYSLSTTLRRSGSTIPATDIAIFSCAKINGAKMLANDKHFLIISKTIR